MKLAYNLRLPEKFKPFLEPHKYKVAHGGRGSAKSHSVARILLHQGVCEKHKVLCCRQIQNSIEESVHALLSSVIEELRLQSFYEIQRTAIIGKNGTEFIFTGLWRNTTKIKSYEGLTRCWVEEAEAVDEESWRLLIPTVRGCDKPEIFVTFNPELETDPVWQRFVVNQPEDCVSIEANWRDNPWFPETLEAERVQLQRTNLVDYENIWEGKPRRAVLGAIYGDEVSLMEREQRITDVPYDGSLQVITGWDIGILDATAIWFAQYHPMTGAIRLIDYYEDEGKGLDYFAKVVHEKPYKYLTHIGPHDIRVREWGSGGQKRIDIARELGLDFIAAPNMTVDDGRNKGGIPAVRASFPKFYIDKSKCARGIECLKRYKRRYNTTMKEFTSEPLHDQHSHGADALRTLITGIPLIQQAKAGSKKIVYPSRSWRVS